MKHGDFTRLARHYRHRPGYSSAVLRALIGVTGGWRSGFDVADVGAGTGKLTEQLAALGLRGYAVEPNSAMLREGVRLVGEGAFAWRKGSAERTLIPSQSVDWVLMGSSFHWANPRAALAEFRRILKPGGFFTAIWNPRDLERSPVDRKVDALITSRVEGLKRVSSGSSQQGIEDRLQAGGLFGNLLYVEGSHVETMSPSRYLGVWRSVNDIQVQAGPQRFAEILADIRREVRGRRSIRVTYRTRSWTVQRLDS